jgi:hypothetical protein
VVREVEDVQNVQEEINCRPSTPIFTEIHEAKKTPGKEMQLTYL